MEALGAAVALFEWRDRRGVKPRERHSSALHPSSRLAVRVAPDFMRVKDTLITVVES
jgi:hypothetical protein